MPPSKKRGRGNKGSSEPGSSEPQAGSREIQPANMNPTVIVQRYRAASNVSSSFGNDDGSNQNNLHRNNLQKTSDHIKQINQITKLIPEFDGSNMPITEFIRECRELSDLLNEEDNFLFIKMLRAKIIGPAKVQLGSRKFSNVQDLLDCLKTAYFPKSNLFDIQTEMSRCRQEAEETALDFGLRVQQILNKAVDIIIDDKNADEPMAAMMINHTNNIAVQFYITGVRLDIGQQLLSKHFSNLDQAIAVAVEIERKLDDMYILHNIKNNDENIKQS